MVIRVYVSLTSGNVQMKGQQEHIKRVFDSKNIPYEEVDIAAPHRVDDKKYMQQQVGKTKQHPDDQPQSQQPDEQQQPTADPILPPQLFHNEAYRGDYAGFFEAVETETMYTYLGLTAPPDEVEFQRQQQQQPD